MRFIASYLKKYKWIGLLAPLFKMLEASFELLIPLVVRQLIDEGLEHGDTRFVLSRVLLLALLAFVGMVSAISAQYFSARAAVGTATDLRRDLFARVTSLSACQTDALGASTLMTRLTGDVNAVQNGVNLTLRLLLRSPFVVFGAWIMAYTVDPGTAHVFSGAVPLLALTVASVMAFSTPLYKKVQEKLDDVTLGVRENLTGARVVRAFGREETEKARFREKTQSQFRLAFRAGRLSSLLGPLTYVIVNLAVIVLLHVGALRVDGGLISRGAVVAQYNYFAQILVELVKFANLIVSVSKALAGAKRVQGVMELSPAVAFPETGCEPDFSAPAVELKNVSLTYYEGADPAVSDLSFSVAPGETVGIVGGTGSGKSSVLRLLSRLYEASAGEVRVFGHDVRDYDEKTLCSLVGFARQKSALFSGTVRDNLLRAAPEASEDALTEAIRASQSESVVASKPEGLDAPVEQLGRNFSGGQKQRLNVARVLVKRPPVLLLDDVSSALDNATGRALADALAALSWRPAVIVTAQRSAPLKNCRRIFVLEDGRITAAGTHGELLETSEAYRFICRCERGEEA